MTFRLRPGLTIATLVALTILCSLGAWQLQRREWKLSLIAQTKERLAAAPISFDEAAERADAGQRMEYQPVYIDGVYANDFETAVFGTYGGAPGVYVFTPLDSQDPKNGARRFIYVNRGFAPQDFRDPSSRKDGMVSGESRVSGLFRTAERKRGFEKWLAPKDQPQDNLYFVRDPRVMASRHSIETAPYYVDSFGDENSAAWPQGGVTRIEFPNRHLEYAFTWFGIAASLLGVYFAYSVRRN
jgi:surfeit locus 1 family protein